MSNENLGLQVQKEKSSIARPRNLRRLFSREGVAWGCGSLVIATVLSCGAFGVAVNRRASVDVVGKTFKAWRGYLKAGETGTDCWSGVFWGRETGIDNSKNEMYLVSGSYCGMARNRLRDIIRIRLP